MNPITLKQDPRLRFPANGAAARVLRPGVKYEPMKKVCTADQATPFKVRQITKHLSANSSFTDLTGHRFGRLTAYGLAEGSNARWACRCDCGTYVLRTAKAVINPTNNKDRCERCRHLEYLKREDYWRQTGRDREWEA